MRPEDRAAILAAKAKRKRASTAVEQAEAEMVEAIQAALDHGATKADALALIDRIWSRTWLDKKLKDLADKRSKTKET